MDNVDWKVEQLLVLCEYKNLRTCLILNKHNKNLWTSLLTSSLIISFYIIDDVVQDVNFIYTRLAFKLWFKYINFYCSNNCCSMTRRNCNLIIVQLIAHILLLCFACKIYRTISLNNLDQFTFDILLSCIFDIDLCNLIAL